jgi:hypothetical protein
MKIKLEFFGSVAGGDPKIKINTRHTTNKNCFAVKDGVFTIHDEIELSPVDEIRICFYDKVHINNLDKDTFIDLKKLEIDDINLQHFILKGKYYPRYDENFYREFSPPNFYQPGTTMYHNGVFVLDIKTPIWKFLMDSYYE